MAGRAGYGEAVKIGGCRKAPEREIAVRIAILTGGVFEIRRLDRGSEAREVLARLEVPVLRPDAHIIPRPEQRHDTNVVILGRVDALLVRSAVIGAEIGIGPSGIARRSAADANSQTILDEGHGNGTGSAVIQAVSPHRLRGLSLECVFDLIEIGIAGMENEDTARRALAVKRTLRTAQHFDPLHVQKTNRRSDPEIGHDERRIVEIIADG